jgi:hypothetical protein
MINLAQARAPLDGIPLLAVEPGLGAPEKGSVLTGS